MIDLPSRYVNFMELAMRLPLFNPLPHILGGGIKREILGDTPSS